MNTTVFSWSMMFVDEPNCGVIVLVDFLTFLQTDSTERPKKKKYEILYKDEVSQEFNNFLKTNFRQNGVFLNDVKY